VESGKSGRTPQGAAVWTSRRKVLETLTAQNVWTDSAREIREYFIPDFTQWKDHDSYQKGLERLLRDLKDKKKIE
jgi:hypothetical protein